MSEYLQYGTSIIASEDLALGRVPTGARYQGETLLDAFTPFRGDHAVVFGRGRGVREYGVTVQRFFSSLAAAVQFCLTHEDTLPVQADLTFVDSTAGIALTMANAVGQARIAQRLGVCVVIEYTFTGARFESDDVPDAPEDSESVKAATIALAENDESKVITFDVPFGATPRFVGVTVLAPSGELGFAAWVDDSTLDAAGFTVRLGAAVPAAGYKLSWSAIL